MKTISVSKRDEKGGLSFDTVSPFVGYEMELSGRVLFLVSEGTDEHVRLSNAAANPDHDYNQILPALQRAAFRILEEGDYKVARISKLQATMSKELAEAIADTQVKVEIDPEMKKNLDKIKKEQRE